MGGPRRTHWRASRRSSSGPGRASSWRRHWPRRRPARFGLFNGLSCSRLAGACAAAAAAAAAAAGPPPHGAHRRRLRSHTIDYRWPKIDYRWRRWRPTASRRCRRATRPSPAASTACRQSWTCASSDTHHVIIISCPATATPPRLAHSSQHRCADGGAGDPCLRVET
jgi:hypothetical protein